MLSTVEMRWFFTECPLDRDVHLGTHTERQERSDWYAMPCHPRCGIKLREGKLETKLFDSDLGMRTIGSASGKLEAWKKWSLQYAGEAGPTAAELEKVGWLEVAKIRFLQRFEVDGVSLHATSTRPTNGCEFELTQLAVLERTFWTVGFEAVGSAESIEHNLQQAVASLLGRGGLQQPFTSDRSFGYAQWLAEFNARLVGV